MPTLYIKWKIPFKRVNYRQFLDIFLLQELGWVENYWCWKRQCEICMQICTPRMLSTNWSDTRRENRTMSKFPLQKQQRSQWSQDNRQIWAVNQRFHEERASSSVRLCRHIHKHSLFPSSSSQSPALLLDSSGLNRKWGRPSRAPFMSSVTTTTLCPIANFMTNHP